jgi:CubicO group peptidase (beta-lactamase class C family)
MKRNRICFKFILFCWLGNFLLTAPCPSAPAADHNSFEAEKKSATPSNPEAMLKRIRDLVSAAMREWHVPGAGLGIVKDGKVMFQDGLGLRNVEENLPVTSKTRFVLGSTTKAFTTMAMGILVDEGKLDWDKPVESYMPHFKMMDDWATLRLTPRDMVTHRSGLPRHDLVWVGSSFTLKELVESLKYLEPSRELRSAFQYNNLMYMAAGYLVGKVAGIPWEDFIRMRIFGPLGMANSGCTLADFQSSAEFSFAYRYENNQYKRLDFPPSSDILRYGPRASGSINTTAEDMCRWLLLHLQNGAAGGKQVISKKGLDEMHTPQVIIPEQKIKKSEVMHESYGLGWSIDSYRGHYRVHHGGSTMGYNSYVTLFPHENLGIVVLANASSALPGALSHSLSDLLLGLEPVDWNKRMAEEIRSRQAPRAEDKRIEGTVPGHELKDYAAEYEHPAYGRMIVSLKDGTLIIETHGLSSPLEHWHYETFVAKEGELKGQKLTFHTNALGVVHKVSAPLEPAVKDIIFSRADSPK